MTKVRIKQSKKGLHNIHTVEWFDGAKWQEINNVTSIKFDDILPSNGCVVYITQVFELDSFEVVKE